MVTGVLRSFYSEILFFKSIRSKSRKERSFLVLPVLAFGQMIFMKIQTWELKPHKPIKDI